MAIVKGMAFPDGPAVPDAGQGTQPGRRLLSLSPNTQRSFLNLLNAPYRGKSIV
jgi:hypothetical protein